MRTNVLRPLRPATGQQPLAIHAQRAADQFQKLHARRLPVHISADRLMTGLRDLRNRTKRLVTKDFVQAFV